MPRKSTKSALAAASRSSSKRPAPDTPTRQSKRAKATARKSYAEPDTDDDDTTVKKAASSTDEEDNAGASAFEEQSDGDPSSELSPEEATSDEDTNIKKPSSRGRSAKKDLALRKKQADETELWKPGAKLAPGTQLIIKKPKARDAGDTPYTDETLHANTILFLKDLAANNDRQWLKMHDPDYRAALSDFTTFTEKLSEKIIEVDELIPELPVKDVIYRIYRDIRFSKDPTPYKTYFSAAWSRTGRKGPYAHYYLQVQHGGGSFVGGGLWQPEAAALAKIRRDIDRNPHKLKRVLTDPGIRKVFLANVADDEKKAVKAFANLSTNQSTALKRNPKSGYHGYDHDHRDIELLRLRNFTLGKKLLDHEVIGPGCLNRITEFIACMVPFISYLNSVVMPDEEPSESSEEESDDENETAAADEGG